MTILLHCANPGGEEREKETERVLEEVMAENFPNLVSNMNINIQET